MIDFFKELSGSDFMPHGHCFFWKPEILWMHIISDGITALSYFAIPFFLVYFVKKRKDLPFKFVFIIFGVFIILCGATHVMAIYVMWDPVYRLDGIVKAGTAVASLATAAFLVPLIPQILKLSSPEMLRKVNEELQGEMRQKEITEAKLKEINEDLEALVERRTQKLAEYTDRLQQEINQRKTYERKLALANERLNDFAYVISHDLKAPLRSIANISDFLQMDYSDKLDAEGIDMLKMLTGKAENMNEMINSILNYSKMGNIEGEATKINMEAMIAEITKTLDPPDHFKIKCSTRLPEIYTDPFPVYQIFLNLLQNSLKYNNKKRGRVEISAEIKGEEIVFSVKDNGEGIAKKDFARIFKLFQTTARAKGKEGSGIGLSIVKRVVEMLDGKIQVESEIGKFTCFTIFLPKNLLNDHAHE